MNIKRKIALFLSLSILMGILFTSTLYADNQSTISLEFDKTKASVGEVIKASLKINNIKNFGGYEVRLRYNPEVLQAIDVNTGSPLEDKTPPAKGDLLQNATFSPFGLTNSVIKDGILDFGNIYMKIQDYKKSGKAETTGTLAVIGFKVLKDAATEVIFDDLNAMPGAINGTMVFDWEGAQIKSGYSIINPGKINESSSPIPLPSFTAKPQQSDTAVSPASSAAPEASASSAVSPDSSKAPGSNSSDNASDSNTSASKSNLMIIIIILASVVVVIPVIIVLILKRKK
ncbi:MAG TPA: cohesin domain-containing protein [Pseudobacteroides sp.]|uniref:cohesin domain-containing protein n=1 Tax=Pseudobacteroides sp. TaxID=1968840 RepID=UPI002F94C36B